MDLVVVGDCNPDVLVSGSDVVPVFGQYEKLVDDMSLAVGGSASITAIAAAKLGLKVALVAAVGDDDAGRFMLARLAEAGVDVTAVVVHKTVATGMTVILSAGEDRAILTAPGAIATLTADDVPFELLRSARYLHVSSYFLQPALAAGVGGLFRRAHKSGATTSLDTNWDPAERWQVHEDVLAETDLFLPNRQEAILISGHPDPLDAGRTLAALGPTVVTKLGADGALAIADRERHQARPPGISPIDTTGAGDTFNAALLAGLARGLALPKALAVGCAAGSASTLALGGTGGQPDWQTALSQAAAIPVESTPL